MQARNGDHDRRWFDDTANVPAPRRIESAGAVEFLAYIVSALLPQNGTRLWVPGGAVFREQQIILTASGDDAMPRFHAPKLFMGAAAVGAQGVMQADVVLASAERRLIDRAEEVVLLVDSSKFQGSGNVVCDLEEIDVVVTDAGITNRELAMLKNADIKVIVAD